MGIMSFLKESRDRIICKKSRNNPPRPSMHTHFAVFVCVCVCDGVSCVCTRTHV